MSEEPERSADAPLTSEHLRAAAEWAIEARAAGKAIPIDGHERAYDQWAWDCGTACCIHGAASLIARGRPTRIGPSPHDYRDIPDRDLHRVLAVLWNASDSYAPERILEILGEGRAT